MQTDTAPRETFQQSEWPLCPVCECLPCANGCKAGTGECKRDDSPPADVVRITAHTFPDTKTFYARSYPTNDAALAPRAGPASTLDYAPLSTLAPLLEELRGRVCCVGGIIGVGKTSLGAALERAGAALAIDTHFAREWRHQAMLARYVQDPKHFGAPFQLVMQSDTLNRHTTCRALAERNVVALYERGVVENYVFATLNRRLGNIETRDFEFYESLMARPGAPEHAPDLFIYLHVSRAVALHRMGVRGDPAERGYDPSYLDALNNDYFLAMVALLVHPTARGSVAPVPWNTSCVLLADAAEDAGDYIGIVPDAAATALAERRALVDSRPVRLSGSDGTNGAASASARAGARGGVAGDVVALLRYGTAVASGRAHTRVHKHKIGTLSGPEGVLSGCCAICSMNDACDDAYATMRSIDVWCGTANHPRTPWRTPMNERWAQDAACVRSDSCACEGCVMRGGPPRRPQKAHVFSFVFYRMLVSAEARAATAHGDKHLRTPCPADCATQADCDAAMVCANMNPEVREWTRDAFQYALFCAVANLDTVCLRGFSQAHAL